MRARKPASRCSGYVTETVHSCRMPFNLTTSTLIAFAGTAALSIMLLERFRAARRYRLHLARLQAEVAEHSQTVQRFRSLVDEATDAIVIVDTELGWFVEEANTRAQTLFGLSKEQLLSHCSPVDLSPEFQPDGQRSRDAAVRYTSEAINGAVPTFEWVHVNAQGIEIPCRITLSRFPDPERKLVRASIIDLTEYKREQAARSALSEQLTQAQKLESVGQMTGGVAHDFNNLLSVILGSLEVLALRSHDSSAKQLIETAVDATMKGARLTRSMLNFARRTHVQPEIIQLNEVIESMGELICRTLPANIRVDSRLSPSLSRIRADVSRTESALLNLVLNARDAMPYGGCLHVSTQNLRVCADSEQSTSLGVIPGQYVQLAVGDTGHGIPAETLSQILKPFFTTKDKGANSGLGLSMVKEFMIQSGGNILIESSVGSGTGTTTGTLVRLFFPVEESISTNAEGSLLPDAVSDRRARILIVEDQSEVLAVLQTLLEYEGHEIIAAGSAAEAVALSGAGERFDLLITDMVLPGTTQGWMVARQLTDRDPDLRVIYLTGYLDATVPSEFAARDCDLRLMKPVSREKLIHAVNVVLMGEQILPM